MTTDRDTLREKLDRLIIENQSVDGSIDISDQRAMRDEIMQLIDAHDNALKEQLMAGKINIYEDGGDNKRSFPAIPVTHIIEVFNKG